MHIIGEIKKWMNRVAEWLCIIMFAIMVCLVTFQVIVRYVFNAPNPYTEALSQYLFVWMILICGAYVFGSREHMNITFLIHKLSKKGQIIIAMVTEFICMVFGATVMAYGGWVKAMQQMRQMDPALHIPKGVIYLAIPVSGALIVIYTIFNEIMLVRQLKDLKSNAKEAV